MKNFVTKNFVVIQMLLTFFALIALIMNSILDGNIICQSLLILFFTLMAVFCFICE